MPVVWTTGISSLDELNDAALSGSATNDILQRNSSGVYVNRQPVGTETSTTANSGAANDTVINTTNCFFTVLGTMPTTAPFFFVTGLEVKNGTVVNGNMQLSIWQLPENPPTTAQIVTLAFSPIFTQSGASAVQRTSNVVSRLIPAGTIVAGSISSSSATGRYQTATVSAANNLKAFAIQANPLNGTNTVWTSGTEEPYFKMYYKPVLGV